MASDKDSITDKKEKAITLLDYSACRDFMIKQHKSKLISQEKDTDFLSIRINWKTAYKMTKHCVICGSSSRLEMHHMRHIRHMGKSMQGFSKVMNSLNRKQICVCHACHRNIHNGKYDGYSLNDFYDPDLAGL